MASGHPIAAGIFLCLAVGGIGYGALRATRGQAEERQRSAALAVEAHKRMLVEGVTRGQEGDLEGAVNTLSALLREDPTNEDAAYNLGVALGAVGRYDDAEKVLSALIAKRSDDWGATAELAGVYDARGDGERAAQLLDRIPAGEGDLKARFGDAERWGAVRSHARFEALRVKHGLTGTATTAAAPPEPLPQ